MGSGRAALLKYDRVFEIDRTQASQLPCSQGSAVTMALL